MKATSCCTTGRSPSGGSSMANTTRSGSAHSVLQIPPTCCCCKASFTTAVSHALRLIFGSCYVCTQIIVQLPGWQLIAYELHVLLERCACRFQLVYACGSRQLLFARPERVCAIQALLHTLTQLADQDASGCPELHCDGVAVWPPAAERCGAGEMRWRRDADSNACFVQASCQLRVTGNSSQPRS
jgi:hypothetical protein